METPEIKTAETTTSTAISETSPSTKEVVEVVKTVYLSNNSSDSSENNSARATEEAGKTETLEITGNSSEEETDEVEEEALEIPELGKKVESNNVLNNLSCILFFVLGALLGTVSTWFLLSDYRKMNQKK